MSFVLAAFTATIAGLAVTSLSRVGAWYNGAGYDFKAVTAIVIGGMTLAGGRGTILGVLGGSLIIGILNNIMTLIGIGTFSQDMIRGAIFIIVVGINAMSLTAAREGRCVECHRVRCPPDREEQPPRAGGQVQDLHPLRRRLRLHVHFRAEVLRPANMTSILNAIAMNATVAIGFTVVMICGQLDLSIGSVITFAGVLTMGLEPILGFAGAVAVAILGGALVGLANGLLVAKAKINSFIVTLGTMTLLQGAIYQFSGGNSISVSTDEAFAISDFLGKSLVPLITSRVLITLVLVVVAEFVLRRTRAGRNFYIVGGNRTTAWLAGINTDRYLIAAFVLSGVTAAIGGVVSVLVSTAATLKLGENSLMYVISATIIGGTAMSGGKGGVLRSVVAIMSLEMLYTGIILFGLGNEVKIFFAGLILAYVVLYEAYAVYRHEKTLGQRPELMKEVERETIRVAQEPRGAAFAIRTISGSPL